MSRITEALAKPFDPDAKPPELDVNNPDFVYRPGYTPYVLWEKNGDCPGDGDLSDAARYARTNEGAVVGFFRRAEISGLEFCPMCNNVYHNHGEVKKHLVDKRDVKYKGMVCPGTWLDVRHEQVEILSKEQAEEIGLVKKKP